MSKLKLDEIGYWSEIKLDIIKKYAQAYSTIMNAQRDIRAHLYIDGFAGAGVHISKNSKKYIPGSPLNALNVRPPFMEYHFIDLDGGRANALRRLCVDSPNVHIYEGDCNTLLLGQILPLAKYSHYKRALCLLDPYALDINWKTIFAAGQMRSIEIFLNFPVMDMNRNILRKNPDKVNVKQRTRMDEFWGDDTWSQVAYVKTKGLFGEIEEKRGMDPIVKAYQSRLRDLAGFRFVPEPLPMRNSIGGILYYLFFASPNKTGGKIVREIFDKYSDKGVI